MYNTENTEYYTIIIFGVVEVRRSCLASCVSSSPCLLLSAPACPPFHALAPSALLRGCVCAACPSHTRAARGSALSWPIDFCSKAVCRAYYYCLCVVAIFFYFILKYIIAIIIYVVCVFFASCAPLCARVPIAPCRRPLSSPSCRNSLVAFSHTTVLQCSRFQRFSVAFAQPVPHTHSSLLCPNSRAV